MEHVNPNPNPCCRVRWEVEEMLAPSSTKTVTVRRTLAASTAMLTASGRALAKRANCCCRAEVSA